MNTTSCIVNVNTCIEYTWSVHERIFRLINLKSDEIGKQETPNHNAVFTHPLTCMYCRTAVVKL